MIGKVTVRVLEGDYAAYCDGGVIGPNPSVRGGTWAFVLVDALTTEDGCHHQSGVVTPAEAGVDEVTNNLTELLAAVQALEAVHDGWKGTLYTDSHVTRCRLVNKKPGMNGIPPALEARMWEQRERLGPLRVVLLDGHPTRAQLASGVGKRGNPCSKWNKKCDDLCRERAFHYDAERAAGANGGTRRGAESTGAG